MLSDYNAMRLKISIIRYLENTQYMKTKENTLLISELRKSQEKLECTLRWMKIKTLYTRNFVMYVKQWLELNLCMLMTLFKNKKIWNQ